MSVANLNYVIRLDAETQGLRQASQAYQQFIGSIKAGIGIDIGGRIVQAIDQIKNAMIEGARTGINYNAMLQDMAADFRTVMGSSELAALRIKELQKFGDANAFELSGLAKATKILETLTGGALTGRESMNLIGDAAKFAGASFEDVATNLARFYSNAMAGKQVSRQAMELERMGLITGETAKKIELLQAAGAKGPEIWAVAEQALGRFSGEMERRGQTFTGRMAQLREAWEQAMGEMMMGAMGPATGGAKDLTDALAKPETVQVLREMGVELRQIVESVAAFTKKMAESADTIKEVLTVVKALAEAWLLMKVGNIVAGGVGRMVGGAGAAAAGGAAAGAVAGVGKAATGAGGAAVGGRMAMGALGGPVGIAMMSAMIIWEEVKAYGAKQQAIAETAAIETKADNTTMTAMRQRLVGLDSIAAKQKLLADLEEQAVAAQLVGNKGLEARLDRLAQEVAAVDEVKLAAQEKANVEKKAKETADLNARANAKTLDKMNTDIARDKGAFQEKFGAADRPEQIDLAKQYIADLRKEQETVDPAKHMGEDPEEFRQKAARYKELYGEIATWEQRLQNLHKADERETTAARKKTMRDLQGQSYRDLLSGQSADQRVGLLSSGAQAMIAGGGAGGKPPDPATLEKIRAGIDKLVELNKAKPDDAGMWAE